MDRFPLAVPIGGPAATRSTPPTLEERLRMVVETAPGTMPWRPRYGLSLADLAGESLTVPRLATARWRVLRALGEAFPEGRVLRCDLHVVRVDSRSGTDRTLPAAERALVALGSAAHVEIDVAIELPGHPTLSARVSLDG